MPRPFAPPHEDRSLNSRRGRPGSRSLRQLLIALGVFGLPALAGCNAYPQSTFEVQSDFAWDIQILFVGILIAAAFVFITVEGALIYAAIRFRRRPGDGLPRQFHGSTKLEVAWTMAPAVILAFVLVPSTATIFKTQAPAPADALLVRVVGHQFWWEFEYPELHVRTANEVHMPVGRPVNFALESADVIHSFWIPALGGKRDVIPGQVNYLWWTASSTGMFPGQCAELCGLSHANMRLRAFVQSPEDFDAWVRAQAAPATQPAVETAAGRGSALFQQRGCAGCHTVNGTPAQARVGPDLTHFGARTTLAAAVLANTPENVRAWLRNPPEIKPGSLMPNLGLSSDDLSALAEYLESLQ